MLPTFITNSILAGVLTQVQPTYATQVVLQQQPMVEYGQPVHVSCPQSVAWWAIPSNTCSYTMYRVGGGCVFPRLADPPCPDEGTWGWDYVGRYFCRNVILGWWHGRAYQGGSGAYRTDGPGLNHGEGKLGDAHKR